MKRLAFIALFAAGAFWGLGFPLGKLALREIDAAHMVLLRFAVAALAAAPFAFRDAQTRALFRSPPVLGAGALYGVTALAMSLAFLALSVPVATRSTAENDTMAPEKRLFKYSILYLFALFAVLVVDRVLTNTGVLA